MFNDINLILDSIELIQLKQKKKKTCYVSAEGTTSATNADIFVKQWLR